MRIVLDTNVFVSFALDSAGLRPLRRAWREDRFQILVSDVLIHEIKAVLGRPKLVRFLEDGARERLLAQIRDSGEWVALVEPYPEFSDSTDRYLLAMLRDSDADALITGDKVLLKLERFEGTPILSPAEFLRRLGG